MPWRHPLKKHQEQNENAIGWKDSYSTSCPKSFQADNVLSRCLQQEQPSDDKTADGKKEPDTQTTIGNKKPTSAHILGKVVQFNAMIAKHHTNADSSKTIQTGKAILTYPSFGWYLVL